MDRKYHYLCIKTITPLEILHNGLPVCVCDLWSYSEIRDQGSVNMSQPRVYVEISLKHTQPTKEQTARSSGVHAALCSVKGTVVSLCVCVCLTYAHHLPSHLKRCCLGYGVRCTGSSMIT